MKKIAVITLHRVINFGSALQAYATIKAIGNIATESAILIDYVPTQTKQKKTISQCLIDVLRWIKSCLTGKEFHRIRQLMRFHHFLKQIPHTPEYSYEKIHNNPPFFSGYLTGSDQVWNPLHMKDDYTFLLDFAPSESRKCAYAASFGGNMALTPEYREAYSTYLNQYQYATVREDSGEKYFNQLTGKSAKCVLDPTFLLSKAEWLNLLPRKTNTPHGRFILCYFVSYVFLPYLEAEKIIDELSRRLGNLSVVCIGGIGGLSTKYHFISDAGPLEFLDLFNKADFVITNSFHGTAFSINFRKKFLSILNPNATSDDRVRNILEKTGMTSCGLKTLNEMKDIDFDAEYAKNENRINDLVAQSKDELTKIIDFLNNTPDHE